MVLAPADWNFNFLANINMLDKEKKDNLKPEADAVSQSEEGKEAVVALLTEDNFFGEGCLAGQPVRMATATALEDSAIVRLGKKFFFFGI